MATKKWSDVFKPPIIVWLAIWIFASFMLYKYLKDGAPWPLGGAMPF